MESGDGRWIHARGTQADEDAEYQARSADGWPAVVAGPLAWPSTGTSAGTSTGTSAGTSTGASAGASAGKRWGRGGIPGFSGWMAAAVAVVAAAAGVVIGFLLVKSW
jgi:hypothetical protein